MSTIYRFADIRGQENKFVRECQSGSAQAWDELVRRHQRRIYNQCYRFTRRVCDAQDLTQDVLLRVYCTLGSFREEELSFVAWLNLVTRNLLIDHYRRTRRDRMMMSLDAVLPWNGRLVTMKENPAVRYEHAERRGIVGTALAKLPLELQETVFLYEIQGLSYGETAVRTGVPVGTVKSRLHRGRAALGHLLRRYREAA
ncbi:MAG TPA: sigma-70 family RNA polymerase sigma factor [Bryobacteraceae bacterium]|nr:sigma-70 family RNA polymerase sigma factor [Bryobacteraceae bacterium]